MHMTAACRRPMAWADCVDTLMGMAIHPTIRLAFVAATVACLVGLTAIPAATAVPSAAQTAADRARVDRAVEKLETARQESARIDALVQEASAGLDDIIAKQQRARERLSSRARAMYRSGETSFISMLLGAESFQDFVVRWDLLMRMNRQDAEDLIALQTARAEAEESANFVMALQAEQAEAIEATAAEVARARKELASSEAALKAYESRIAEKPKPIAASTQSDSVPQISGSGAWQTGVASHYGRSFTGRGASGESIGPYSMMVAHNTLPFGTLVEFEYNGKKAVASVQDRGPHVSGRMWDLGPGVVRVLGFSGVHEVRWRVIKR